MAATAISVDTLPSINPATGEALGYFEKTPVAALPRVVARARAAQSIWAHVPLRDRCERLRNLRDCIMSCRDQLADVVVAESGKPRVEALFADIFVAVDTTAYFAKNAERLLRPERVPHHSLAAKAKSGTLTYEPLGVIGIISSWNYPLAIPLSQIIPAVAAGNSVICKSSDFTPHCGALIEKLFVDAGFPKDLVTVIQGAKRLIPTVLELGGKDAMLVLADANLDVAASAAVWGSYTNCGQVCLSVERIFVEQSVSDEFAARCVAKTKKLRLGPGNDPNTDVGPMIRPLHVQRMVDLVEDAVSRGARVLCGGHPRVDLGPNFFEPTVITNVDSTMKLFQEETFGPILAIQTVADAEEAITRANDSPFALSASVWTRDASRGQTIAKRLRAGAVMVNDAISYFAIAEAPHGGCAASGWGRTHGKAGLLEMVQTKYIDVDRLPSREKPWWYRYGADLERAADAFLQFEYSRNLAVRLSNARAALKTMFRNHGLK